MARRVPYVSLARDKSRRPVRGSPTGDMVEGNCEVPSCAAQLHRGDRFVTYMGNRLMCCDCHESGAVLPPVKVEVRRMAGTRAKRGGRGTKREQLSALRAARHEQLRRELQN